MSDDAASTTPTTAISHKRERSVSEEGEQTSPSVTKKMKNESEEGAAAAIEAEVEAGAGADADAGVEESAKPDVQMADGENAEKDGDDAKPTSVIAPPESAALPATPSVATTEAAAASTASKPDPSTQTINMRCLIVTQDASIIIGKAGRHVNEIREKSSARVNVSESRPGNPERILSVQGALDAVSKAFGLIVRRINDEPFDVPSLPGSKPVTIKFIVPNSKMGKVIGKGGSKMKEIQEASGARLSASEVMLPGSTERILSVAGVADAIHIAVYYIGNILLEDRDNRSGGGAGMSTSAGQYQPSGSPVTAGGMYGQAPPRGGAGGYGGAPGGASGMPPGAGQAVQQFWIPNELVGPIIGKGGVKINEIRTQSQCTIRVTDPGTPAVPGGPVSPNERLVVIQGSPMNINTAVALLHQRLEQEKQKKAMGGVMA